jgi:hypothetical protein
MRWQRGHRSANVEDRRFERRSRIPIPRRGGTQLGCGGILLLLVLSIVFKTDLFTLLDAGGAGGVSMTTPADVPPYAGGEDPDQLLKEFISFVLDDNQETWARVLPNLGVHYQDAKLVLFRDAVESACGFAQSATGPFYCPGDQKVYVDLGFYQELADRFGAPGDFAQAYVLAHEIGHHVQNLLGTERQVRGAQRRSSRDANRLSVAMELQADCYAGVWAHSARRELLEPGDVEEGLRAAAAIGDDRIQRMSGRYVNPETFTHGSSEQRMTWFRRGLESGDPEACDTLSNKKSGGV